MYQITEVRMAPRNTAESAEEAAHEASIALGVYCFGDYNDWTHHESVYITDAPSKQAYDDAIMDHVKLYGYTG